MLLYGSKTMSSFIPIQLFRPKNRLAARKPSFTTVRSVLGVLIWVEQQVANQKHFEEPSFIYLDLLIKSGALNFKNFQNLNEMKLKEYNPGSEVKSKILPKIQCVSNMTTPILTRNSLKVNCTPSLRGNAHALRVWS